MVSQCIHIINCTIKILSRSDKKLNTNVITTFVKQHAIPYHISEVYCLNFLYADVAKEHTLIENYGKAWLIMDNLLMKLIIWVPSLKLYIIP